jgi:hypothetical protein
MPWGRFMPYQSIGRWLVQTAAVIAGSTMLWALGAAVFALLCGGMSWVLGADKTPFDVLWATLSGAIAGFLLGCAWAIDLSVSWPASLPPSTENARPSSPSGKTDTPIEEAALRSGRPRLFEPGPQTARSQTSQDPADSGYCPF